MNGASGELPAKINSIPNNNKMTIIGINHQSFFCHRKTRSSPIIPNLQIKLFIDPILVSHHLVWIHLLTVKLPKAKTSIPLLANVFKASTGEATIGSPLRLKEVFNRTGTPVALPNFFTI